MIGIYKITNLINGKCYIGQSINIEKRWKNHQVVATNPNDNGYNYPLYQAIRKYGQKNFSWEVIEECDKNSLDEREIYWISYYNSYNNGYNQTLGGNNIPSEVKWTKLSEEQVKEIKNKLLTQEYTLEKLSKEYNVHKDTIRDINNGWTWIEKDLQYPLYISHKSALYQKKKNYCVDCGKEISNQSTRCINCYKKTIENPLKPNKEELQQVLKENNGNFTKVGKRYGVSDNQVRKWCKKYEIPFHTKDYKKIKEKPKRMSPMKIKVNQYDLNNNYIQTFESYAAAARWLEDNNYLSGNLSGVRTQIGEVCRGKRKTAYKFIWRNAK